MSDVTGRDDSSGTVRDQVPGTMRDGGVGDGGWTRLPRELEERFEVVRALGTQGAEADGLVVRVRESGELRVLKAYRSGVEVDEDALRVLAQADAPHVVRLEEFGQADGRWYEVQEFIDGGSLADMIASGKVSDELVREVVSELTAALAHVHDRGVVHRDVKPGNVLIRRRDPLDLVLGDFGLSRAVDGTQLWASRSRTAAYASPEAIAGNATAAQDWWALGMITVELLTGEHPFRGMQEGPITAALATRPVDLSRVQDHPDGERWYLLCRGLLTRDPAARWREPEVSAWLRGERPQVTEDDTPAVHASGYRFAATDGDQPDTYTDRPSLAAALAGHWSQAARILAVRGERYTRLRAWLTQFDDPALDELLDDHLDAFAEPVDERLARLLVWLDPSLPPIFRGYHLDRRGLASIAAAAVQNPHGPEAAALQICQAAPILEILARLDDQTWLAEAQTDWRMLDTEIDQIAHGVEEGRAGPHLPTDSRSTLSYRSLTLDDAGIKALRRKVTKTPRIRFPPTWYSAIANPKHATPAQLLILDTLHQEAETASQAWERDQREQRQADGQVHPEAPSTGGGAIRGLGRRWKWGVGVLGIYLLWLGVFGVVHWIEHVGHELGSLGKGSSNAPSYSPFAGPAIIKNLFTHDWSDLASTPGEGVYFVRTPACAVHCEKMIDALKATRELNVNFGNGPYGTCFLTIIDQANRRKPALSWASRQKDYGTDAEVTYSAVVAGRAAFRKFFGSPPAFALSDGRGSWSPVYHPHSVSQVISDLGNPMKRGVCFG